MNKKLNNIFMFLEYIQMESNLIFIILSQGSVQKKNDNNNMFIIESK